MSFINARERIPENFESPEVKPYIVKVNIPEDENDYKNGNGEGCWGYILDPADKEKYDKGEGTFNLALLNSSINYMGILAWGDIIQAEGKGPDRRPVMNLEWFNEQITK